MNLFFVCSGNTCRSPLALAAWQARAPAVLGASADGVIASSAGLCACEGTPATPQVVALARSWGVDLSRHTARRLSAEDLAGASLVCVMSGDQASWIASLLHPSLLHPEAPVRLLGEFASGRSVESEPRDILDPFGGSIEAYETCANRIQDCVRGLATEIARGHLLPRTSSAT